MQKIFSKFLSLLIVLVMSFSVLSSLPGVLDAATNGTLVIDTINGVPPTSTCIPGTVTIVGHGVTGSAGGPYNLDIEWGDGVTTTQALPSGGEDAFTFTITHTPVQVTTTFGAFLYHSQRSGNDSHVDITTFCAAPPTTAILTVKKHVINDNVIPGTAVASNFTLHVKNPANVDVADGGNGVSSPASGSETGKDYIITPTAGNYSVSENVFAGYTQTGISCSNTTNNTPIVGSSFALTAGKNYVCTITNNDTIPAPTLRLIKTVVNTHGGNKVVSDFVLKIDSTIVTSGAVNTTTTGTHTVSEVNLPGYTAGNWGGDCAANGSITLASGDTKTCTITNSDNATNSAPTLSGVPAVATIPELSAYTFTATAIDSDIPANTLTFSLLSAPTGATINSSTGVFAWTPTEAQGPGVYSFTVRVSDGTNNTNANITITVTEVNATPVAQLKTLTTNEDTAGTVTLTATDSDVPAQTLTFAIGTNPSHGTVTLLGNVATYTPDPNYTGSDLFTYLANDGITNGALSTVSVTVSSANDTPTISGVPASASIPELSTYTFTATGSDIDVGTTLIYSLLGEPAGATINSSTGAFSWTPSETQGPGSYPFTVSVSDGSMDAQAPITITVTEVNSAPLASGASVATSMNTDSNISLSASDSDIPVNTLTYSIVSGPSNGTLGAVSGNQVTYSPNTSFVGSDSFTFKANDGTTDSNTVTVSITVSNDAPSIGEIGNQTVNEGETLSFTATATDTNSDTLTYSLSGAPAGASINPTTGVFSWTPTEAQAPEVYTGVIITVTDGAMSDSQTFSITVNEINLIPIADAQSASTNEDTAKNIVLTGSDTDLPPQIITFVIVGNPTNGTLSGFNPATGEVTYTPSANFNGSDSFSFAVSDGVVNSTSVNVSLTVNSVNDLPIITLNGSSDTAIVQGGTFTDPGASCTDVEAVSPFGASVSGTVDTNVVGTYTLTYQCNDNNEGSSDTVTRTVHVQATPSACADGVDNDDDGLMDANDPGCWTNPNDSETYDAADNNETDPADVCPNDQGIQTSTEQCTATPPTDVCPNIEGNQSSVPEGKQLVEGQCVDIVQSADVCLNIAGIQADIPDGLTMIGDGVCGTVAGGGNGGGGGGGGRVIVGPLGGSSPAPAVGRVLGEETTCGIYISKFLKQGRRNDTDAVKKVQQFLNDYLSAGLTVDGNFGPLTDKYVRIFQTNHKEKILYPWGLTGPTGIVYLTTTTEINNIMCPALLLPIPTLTPFETNPDFPRLK